MIYVLIIAVICLIARFSFCWKAINLDDFYKNGILYFGHRGERYSAPENSISSYKTAINIGLKAIELDIRLTKDGKIICSHNIDLERETTGSGFICERTFAELSNVKTGRTFPKRKQDKIPLLEEVIEKLSDNTLINIEVKTDSIFDLTTTKALIRLIKKGKIRQKIIISSFNPIVVRYIKMKFKRIPTAFIYEHAKHFKGVFISRADCLHPDAEFVDDRLISFCDKRNMSINVWTVNNPYSRDWLIEKGINGIITDNPNITN